MKTKYLIAIALIWFVCQTGYAQKSVNQLFDKFTQTNGVTSAKTGSIILTIAGLFTDTMGITSVEVIVLDDCEKSVKQTFARAVKNLNDKDYETMLQSNSDGEQTKVLVKIKHDIIRELVVLTTGKDSAMIRIKGKIDPANVDKVVKQHKHGC